MTRLLGKRERRDQFLNPGSEAKSRFDGDANQHLHDLLQQHFESKFKPLKGSNQKVHKQQRVIASSPKDETESGSDWTGIPEEEESPQVVHYHMSQSSRVDVSKEELKTFMVWVKNSIFLNYWLTEDLFKSTKPPSAVNKQVSTAKPRQPEQVGSEEAATDTENLKKDLALQRLLKESHLLESQSSLSLSGQNRHKAFDLRLQDLGSKSSIYTQQKMPLAQRKGIIAKAAERDESRRREAKENGIVLENAVKGKKKTEVRRQRGIGAPSVGKFQGGMLKLSRRDLSEIVGPKKTPKTKGKR